MGYFSPCRSTETTLRYANLTDARKELFDSAFCYFPITFRSPPDDPYGITTQDLKTRLRDCIAASEQFAPFAFPQLLDKLDSTSPNVKVGDTVMLYFSIADSFLERCIANNRFLRYIIWRYPTIELFRYSLGLIEIRDFKCSRRRLSR